MKEPKMTHLTKRNSVYYFRRKIPLELRHLYAGKAEIIFSLQTKNRADAEPLARKLGVQYDEEFAQARTDALQATNEAAPQPTPDPTSSVKPKLADGLTMENFDVLVARYIQRMREQREAAAGDFRTYEQFLARLRAIVSENKEFLKLGEHPLWDDPRPLWQVEAQRAAAKAVLKGKSPVPAPSSVISTTAHPPVTLAPDLKAVLETVLSS
jgi:hypothetical protein